MKLLLIDGHYYVYRSFFAIQNLSNSRGEPTNAIFGFTKTLRRMLKDLRPELGAVVWDEGLPQRRVELQPAYKETRKEMPQPMIPQLDFIQKLAPLLGFRNISLPNTEADDLMGCYALAACKRGVDVVLATNDKDLFQLVGPCVKVYTTAKADLASPKDAFALLGEPEVTAKWDVSPKLIGDVLALSGDPVDNIPGVGLGRKTAAALVREFGGLEALLAKIDKVKNQRTREKLTNARDQILQNRKMVELDCDLELPARIDDLRIKPDYPALIAALEKCEFKSLLQEVREEAARSQAASQAELRLCRSPRPSATLRCNSNQRRIAPRTTATVLVRIFRKKFERGPSSGVQINRLRRFGWSHVSGICCFSLTCAARIFFVLLQRRGNCRVASLPAV